ncbi:MAG: hypothetical protein AAF602_29375, partial [Myxococcota bacterium]
REVRPGGIVGRLASAEVRVVDPRLSEAHALVTMRAGAFQLLSLRGSLLVDGSYETTIELEPGIQVELAEGIVLTVLEVVLPEDVLAVVVHDRAVHLWADAYSLVFSPEPELVPGYRPGSPFYVISSGSGWLAQVDGGSAVAVAPHDQWTVREIDLRAVAIPLAEVAGSATATTPGSYGSGALHISGRYETVHLARPGREPVVFDGLMARLVTTLGEMNVPSPWEVLAQELWGPLSDRELFRQRYDRLVARLRLRLREHGIRDDLVRLTGTGNVELFLHPGDRFEFEG